MAHFFSFSIWPKVFIDLRLLISYNIWSLQCLLNFSYKHAFSLPLWIERSVEKNCGFVLVAIPQLPPPADFLRWKSAVISCESFPQMLIDSAIRLVSYRWFVTPLGDGKPLGIRCRVDAQDKVTESHWCCLPRQVQMMFRSRSGAASMATAAITLAAAIPAVVAAAISQCRLRSPPRCDIDNACPINGWNRTSPCYSKPQVAAVYCDFVCHSKRCLSDECLSRCIVDNDWTAHLLDSLHRSWTETFFCSSFPAIKFCEFRSPKAAI